MGLSHLVNVLNECTITPSRQYSWLDWKGDWHWGDSEDRRVTSEMYLTLGTRPRCSQPSCMMMWHVQQHPRWTWGAASNAWAERGCSGGGYPKARTLSLLLGADRANPVGELRGSDISWGHPSAKYFPLHPWPPYKKTKVAFLSSLACSLHDNQCSSCLFVCLCAVYLPHENAGSKKAEGSNVVSIWHTTNTEEMFVERCVKWTIWIMTSDLYNNPVTLVFWTLLYGQETQGSKG